MTTTVSTITRVHSLNCGTLHAPPNPQAGCHCLLLEDPSGLALVDTGIGLRDVANPTGRLDQRVIDEAGFQFNEADTAVRQIEQLGFQARDVGHIILTHGDPDHTGGLADFSSAEVYISKEEYASIRNGHFRYAPAHYTYGPRWNCYPSMKRTWFGLEARPLALGFQAQVLLIPLFGHTLGHCGVAIEQDNGWLLHVGDAYYLRDELESDDAPISKLSAVRADDDGLRSQSLAELRRLKRDHAGEIRMVCYHDLSEFPV